MKSYCSKSPFTRSDWLLSLAMITAWAGVAGAVESTSETAKGETAKEATDQLVAPTHRQIREIRPEVDGKFPKLHTIATTADGHIVAAVGGQSMKYVMTGGRRKAEVVKEPGAVLLMDSEGTTLQRWDVELTPTAVTVAPDGTIYIGGSGRIAQLGKDGSVDVTIDSPHIGDVKGLREKTAESIRKSRSRMSETFGKQIETLSERVGKIEDKDEDQRTQLETAQLKAYKTQLEMLQKMVGTDGDDSVDEDQIDAGVMRAMKVTSMAASDEDVFVCAADPSQGGYAVWRISRDLNTDSSELILDGLRGCCGQMDINCCKDLLLVSENTKFKVGIYDRHGRAQGSFGRRDRTSREGFGSCCNPMNSMAMSDGTILTAESSIGHIKRFDQEGKLVAYIGKAVIGGGCKHCPLGYDEKNDLYYMMYQDKNAICVLGNSESTPMTLAERELNERQTEFWDKVAGEWTADGTKSKTPGSGGVFSFILGGGRSSASRSSAPIAALTIERDGTAKITEGQYKAYGDKAQLELLPRDKDEQSDAIGIALAIDQVRFLEGTWTPGENDEIATLAFPGQSSVTLKRVAGSEACETECGGAECKNASCTDAACPKRTPPLESVATVQTIRAELPEAGETKVASYESALGELKESEYREPAGDVETAQEYAKQMEIAADDWQSDIPSPTFEYKLLSRKDLGKKAQKTLNKLGAQGWEYCGKVGKEMMFKRVKGYDVLENDQ